MLKITATCLLVVLLSGCASLSSTFCGGAKPYGGLRGEIEDLQRGHGVVTGLIDLPLTAALDTCLLPLCLTASALDK